MQIVDTSLIFKKPCVDLEANTFKSQKSEFYEAWLANFGPFFSNLGLLKARSPSNLVMNNLWCPPILPHAESEKWEENWTKTNYIRSQPVKIDNPQKVEALNHTLTSNLTEDTWKDKNVNSSSSQLIRISALWNWSWSDQRRRSNQTEIF